LVVDGAFVVGGVSAAGCVVGGNPVLDCVETFDGDDEDDWHADNPATTARARLAAAIILRSRRTPINIPFSHRNPQRASRIHTTGVRNWIPPVRRTVLCTTPRGFVVLLRAEDAALANEVAAVTVRTGLL